MGPACGIDTIYSDRSGDVFLTSPDAMSVYPHTSVPGRMVYDLPSSLSFLSRAYKEGGIISMAYACEQAGKNRALPGLKNAFLAL